MSCRTLKLEIKDSFSTVGRILFSTEDNISVLREKIQSLIGLLAQLGFEITKEDIHTQESQNEIVGYIQLPSHPSENEIESVLTSFDAANPGNLVKIIHDNPYEEE